MVLLAQSVEVRRQQLIDKLLIEGITQTVDGRNVQDLALSELEWQSSRSRELLELTKVEESL